MKNKGGYRGMATRLLPPEVKTTGLAGGLL